MSLQYFNANAFIATFPQWKSDSGTTPREHVSSLYRRDYRNAESRLTDYLRAICVFEVFDVYDKTNTTALPPFRVLVYSGSRYLEHLGIPYKSAEEIAKRYADSAIIEWCQQKMWCDDEPVYCVGVATTS